ncbi:hypothetical protein V8F33_002115 [Rhypophila sp. PSN 637]
MTTCVSEFNVFTHTSPIIEVSDGSQRTLLAIWFGFATSPVRVSVGGHSHDRGYFVYCAYTTSSISLGKVQAEPYLRLIIYWLDWVPMLHLTHHYGTLPPSIIPSVPTTTPGWSARLPGRPPKQASVSHLVHDTSTADEWGKWGAATRTSPMRLVKLSTGDQKRMKGMYNPLSPPPPPLSPPTVFAEFIYTRLEILQVDIYVLTARHFATISLSTDGTPFPRVPYRTRWEARRRRRRRPQGQES